MSKQNIHTRTSKKGKKFVAGSIKLAHIKDITKFKRFVKFMRVLCNEAYFYFSKDGIKSVQMSDSNVSMYVLHIKTGAILNRVPLNKTIKVGINLHLFDDILKGVKHKEEVEVFLEQDQIKVVNLTRGYSHTIETKDADKVPKLPQKLQFNYVFQVSAENFKDALNEANKRSESFKLFGSKEKPKMVVETETGNFSRPLGKKLQGDELQICKYSVEYMRVLNPLLPFFKNVKISFAKDYPLQVVMRSNIANLKYILAPRIEND